MLPAAKECDDPAVVGLEPPPRRRLPWLEEQDLGTRSEDRVAEVLVAGDDHQWRRVSQGDLADDDVFLARDAERLGALDDVAASLDEVRRDGLREVPVRKER